MPSALRIVHLLAGALLALLALNAASAAEYTGIIYPRHDLVLSFGTGGQVASIPVERGQRVKAHQILLALDDRTQAIEAERRRVIFQDKGEIDAARQRLRIAQSLFEDADAVFRQTGSISRDEMGRIEAEYAAARGRVEQLEAQEQRELLDFKNAENEREMRLLRAPVGGVVTRIESRVGEWAKPTEPVIHLVDAAVCQLNLHVPLPAVAGLKAGMSVMVRFEPQAALEPVAGRIEFVSPIADPASGLIELRITFRNDKLRVRPGIKGMIDLPIKGARS